MVAKPNCWEYEKCGREEGGANTLEKGVCPASCETRLDGANAGKNGGRACWVVAGTFCKERVSGAHARELLTCVGCPFFLLVQRQEGEEFHMSARLVERLYGRKPAAPKAPRRRGNGPPSPPW